MHFATTASILLCKNGTTKNATVIVIPIIAINAFAEIFNAFIAFSFAFEKSLFLTFFFAMASSYLVDFLLNTLFILLTLLIPYNQV